MTADSNEHRLIGHFRILAPIGRGGMGAVYRAEDLTLRRHVALKLLPPERTAHPESRRRFLREARSAAAVSHPAIATIHEVGEDESGTVFIAMELVEGRTLRALLAEGTPPLAEALRIVHDVARGLARAHAAGIVHRDVKPENVMLDDEGSVKILDFGLAKLREAEALDAEARGGETPDPITTGVRVVGTPEYMSPEQARGAPVGPASDVFALGVLLYELVAGHRPFSGGSSLEVIASILRDEAPRLAGVDDALAALVARCLRSDASERPADAGVVARELAALRGVGAPSLPPRTAASDEVALLTTVASQPAATPAPRRQRALLVVPLAVVLAAGAAAWLAWPRATSSPPAEAHAPRTDVEPELTTLVADDPALLHVAISGDGRTLALARVGGLALRDVRTGEERVVELPDVGRVENVTWVDGRDELLAAVTSSEGEPWIWRVRADGRDPARLLRGRAAVGTAGGDVVYLGSDRTPCEVRIRRADGRERVLHRGSCGGGLTFTADQRAVAYATPGADGAPPQILLLGLDGTARVLVSSPRLHLASVISPVAALPDGCLAVVLAAPAPDTGSGLHRVCPSARSDEPERLARFPSFSAAAIALAPDGAGYVLAVTSQADVAVADLDEEGRPGAPSVVTDSQAEDREPAWIDDRALVFHSNRGGRFGVFRADLGDGSQRRITAEDVHATYPVLGPGGLYYWSTREHPVEGEDALTTLHRVGLDGGGDVEMSTPRPTIFYAEAMPSPRGLRVSCSALECLLGEQVGATYRVGPLTAPPDAPDGILVRGDASMLALSPDASEVAVVHDDTLVVIDRDGLEQRTLLRLSGRGLIYVAWHPSGRWLYATSVGGSPVFELHQVAADGSGATSFYGSQTRWVGSPAVSPDGRRLALSIKRYDRALHGFQLDAARAR